MIMKKTIGRKVKDFLLYGGLDRTTYYNVRGRLSDENRRSNNIFTLLAALAFIITGISATIRKDTVPFAIYFSGAGIFILLFFVNLICAKKRPHLSNAIAVIFCALLLGLGIFIAFTQKDERTTMLLPLFGLVSLVFCYRPIYLVVIVTLTEIVYLIVMKAVQSYDLFFINMVNTIVFSIIGIIGGLYMLSFKHNKHKADYDKQTLLENDVLTGLLNRYSWDNALRKIEKEKIKVTVCSFDVNELKKTNDTKGHLAGDELIIGAAKCIKDIFKDYGDIYRVSGDEFCALIYKDFDQETLKDDFKKKTSEWKGDICNKLSVAIGFAKLDYININSTLDAVRLADYDMYSDKQKYYKNR